MTRADVAAVLDGLGAAEATPEEASAAAIVIRGLVSAITDLDGWLVAAELLDELAAVNPGGSDV